MNPFEWTVRGASIGILVSAALVAALTGNAVGALGFGAAVMFAAEALWLRWYIPRQRTS